MTKEKYQRDSAINGGVVLLQHHRVLYNLITQLLHTDITVFRVLLIMYHRFVFLYALNVCVYIYTYIYIYVCV